MTSPVELNVTKRTERHPKTGRLIDVTEFRRGFLAIRNEQFSDPQTFFEELGSESPRKSLENYCDGLRDFLQSKGLPSDRQPRWVKHNDGDWRECETPTVKIPKTGERISHSLWTKRLEELTEPLSPERLAGELLWDLTQLMKRPAIDDDLWHIQKFTNSYFKFRVSGRLNKLADLGAKGRWARAAGPPARRAKATKIGKIIMDCANEYWSDHPGNRGVASSTAAAIHDNVNSRLRTEQLLSSNSDGRSIKTIGDYIRKNTGV